MEIEVILNWSYEIYLAPIAHILYTKQVLAASASISDRMEALLSQGNKKLACI